MRKLITTLAVCALFVPAFSTPVLAEEPMDTWEVDVCGDDMKELETLPELPNAEPLWEDMAVSSRAASISVNVQSPLESSWRKNYSNPQYEARRIVERTDDFLSQKFGIEFNVTSQPEWTVGKATAPRDILKDAAIKHWKRKEDLMIAFAGPIVDTEDRAIFGVAFNGKPFSLIFDHDYNQNCKSTQHEVGHTYGLQHCNNTCVMRPGSDNNWELFDHLCSSHEQQWNKNKNKYHH